GEGFKLEEKPEYTDADLEVRILGAVRANQGTGWKKIETAIAGVGNDRLVVIRDRLLERRQLVNIIKKNGVEVAICECEARKAARLHTADDPAVSHLAQESRPVPGQSGPPGGVGNDEPSGIWPPPLRGPVPGPV